jgi:hypothetical protein
MSCKAQRVALFGLACLLAACDAGTLHRMAGVSQGTLVALLGMPMQGVAPRSSVVLHKIASGGMTSALAAYLDFEPRFWSCFDLAETRDEGGGSRWLSEFSAYPGASKVCSGNVLGSAEGRRVEIAYSNYATKDAPAGVVAFYARERKLPVASGTQILDLASADGKKHLSIQPVTASYPDCGSKPGPDAQTILSVSEMAR